LKITRGGGDWTNVASAAGDRGDGFAATTVTGMLAAVVI
jgi:hypothetical protein